MWKQELKTRIENTPARSAWAKGVKVYALELVEDLPDECPPNLSRGLLNGAQDWKEYSRGGCALIYDADIAERLCTASELKKTRNGARRPNSEEDWLDVQARALYQAAMLIKSCS